MLHGIFFFSPNSSAFSCFKGNERPTPLPPTPSPDPVSVSTELVLESYFTDVNFEPCQATMCLGHVLGQAR